MQVILPSTDEHFFFVHVYISEYTFKKLEQTDDVDESIAFNELSVAIEKAIGQLPEKTQQIFRLNRLEYFSIVLSVISGCINAWMPAFCTARNCPESVLSFTVAYAFIPLLLPQTKAILHPVILNAFDKE